MTITSITSQRAEQIAAETPHAVLYSQPGCGPCIGVEKALKSAKAEFTKVDVTQDPTALDRVRAHGYTGTPVIEVYMADELIDHWKGVDVNRLAQHFPKEAA
ncbi:MAG: glutaredoxin family protein [Micrococcaceae bacterium]